MAVVYGSGLALSRRLMLDLDGRLGLPVATELLQAMASGYLDDLLVGGVGARTT